MYKYINIYTKICTQKNKTVSLLLKMAYDEKLFKLICLLYIMAINNLNVNIGNLKVTIKKSQFGL